MAKNIARAVSSPMDSNDQLRGLPNIQAGARCLRRVSIAVQLGVGRQYFECREDLLD